jgi:phospholipid/cholesterol/gamma-HCH transport system ATP-binding protein
VGLLRANAGEIRVDGLNIVGLGEGDLERVRRKFAFVFQSSALLDSMSVFDNVAFPLREARQLSAIEIKKRVHQALSELNVEDAAKKLPGELSGGMAQREARGGSGQLLEARLAQLSLRFEVGTDVHYVASLLGQLSRSC